jgi:hypothetical protein
MEYGAHALILLCHSLGIGPPPFHTDCMSRPRVGCSKPPMVAPIIKLLETLSHDGPPYHHPAMFTKKARTDGGGRQANPIVPKFATTMVSCFEKVTSKHDCALGMTATEGDKVSCADQCCEGSVSRWCGVENWGTIKWSVWTRPLVGGYIRREMKQVEAEAEALASG